MKILKRLLLTLGFMFLGMVGLCTIALVGLSDPPEKSTEEVVVNIKPKLKKLSDCFSVWDGSHLILTRRLKERLKDPKSYEHIKTKYYALEGYVAVSVEYRARNGFGGMAIGNLNAIMDRDCKLIKFVK